MIWFWAASGVVGVIVASYTVVYHTLYRRWVNEILNSAGRYDLQVGPPPSNSREQSMIQMGTIFVPTAFVILAAAVQPGAQSFKVPLSVAAIGIYLTWLITIQLSTRLMNDVDHEIILLKERGPGVARLLRDFYGPGQGRRTLVVLRRNHWLAYAILLVYASFFVMMAT